MPFFLFFLTFFMTSRKFRVGYGVTSFIFLLTIDSYPRGRPAGPLLLTGTIPTIYTAIIVVLRLLQCVPFSMRQSLSLDLASDSVSSGHPWQRIGRDGQAKLPHHPRVLQVDISLLGVDELTSSRILNARTTRSNYRIHRYYTKIPKALDY